MIDGKLATTVSLEDIALLKAKVEELREALRAKRLNWFADKATQIVKMLEGGRDGNKG